jgi:hypothetical protein
VLRSAQFLRPGAKLREEVLDTSRALPLKDALQGLQPLPVLHLRAVGRRWSGVDIRVYIRRHGDFTCGQIPGSGKEMDYEFRSMGGTPMDSGSRAWVPKRDLARSGFHARAPFKAGRARKAALMPPSPSLWQELGSQIRRGEGAPPLRLCHAVRDRKQGQDALATSIVWAPD